MPVSNNTAMAMVVSRGERLNPRGGRKKERPRPAQRFGEWTLGVLLQVAVVLRGGLFARRHRTGAEVFPIGRFRVDCDQAQEAIRNSLGYTGLQRQQLVAPPARFKTEGKWGEREEGQDESKKERI